jgi:hypothetical protein
MSYCLIKYESICNNKWYTGHKTYLHAPGQWPQLRQNYELLMISIGFINLTLQFILYFYNFFYSYSYQVIPSTHKICRLRYKRLKQVSIICLNSCDFISALLCIFTKVNLSRCFEDLLCVNEFLGCYLGIVEK